MIHDLIDLFFPKVCAGCEKMLLDAEKVICTTCRHHLPLTNHHLIKENEAYSKFYGRLPLESATALCHYNKKGIVQEMIHKLKYRGIEEVGDVLGNWYCNDLMKIPSMTTVDAIIPVPLHPKKLRQRGYNQVTTFAVALSQGLNVSYNDRLLRRDVYSKTQTKKNLLGRTSIGKAIFDVDFAAEDHNKHYLIVDDVITTGSTLEACGRALLKIPGATISIACMAMSHS